MRKLLSFAIMLCLSLGMAAQGQTRGNGTQNIPNQVEQKFQSEFLKAQNVNWLQKDNRFIAVFTMNGFEMRALYTAAGLWVNTDIDLPIEKIPAKAKDHRSTNYSGFSIKKTGFLDSEKNGSHYYFIVEKNGVKFKLKYDDKGNFLGQERFKG
ncbi:MAG: PepSY-like domain-containing protein [Bacteroidia bacterium]|nr:PepSY-like domain-containing protein [Bacteroidia bacterium]